MNVNWRQSVQFKLHAMLRFIIIRIFGVNFLWHDIRMIDCLEIAAETLNANEKQRKTLKRKQMITKACQLKQQEKANVEK